MDDTGRVPWSRLVFGPWPFVPLPIVLLGALAYFSRSIVVAGTSAETTPEYIRIVLILSVQGIVISIVAATPLVVAGGWRNALRFSATGRRIPRRAVYLGVCATAASLFGIAQVLSRYLAVDDVTGQGVFASVPVAFLSTFLPSLLFAIGITNAIGYLALRIGRQTQLLEAQVRQLEQQQRLIVEADQRVRTEVAEALHDDVQGALLRATLRLSRITEEPDDPKRLETLRAVIADLETLRGSGVRAISRRLTPPLTSSGLFHALEGLADSYAGSIDVRIDMDAKLQSDLTLLPYERQLALYRVAEQALLNASAHAMARHVIITITQHETTWNLSIVDDGNGLPAVVQPGHGSAVIGAWMTFVGGHWALEAADPRGARLRAEVPIT